ncbi:MAG: hypothetical protein IJ551_01595 [Prevotella sp.]|nr:hypothetical protein [Prevotella sp.]
MKKLTFTSLFVLLCTLGVNAQQLSLVESYDIASSTKETSADGDIDGSYLRTNQVGGVAYRFEMQYSEDFTKYGMCFLQLSPILYEAWDKAGRLDYECEEISSDAYSWTKDCDPVHSRVFWMKETGCNLDSIMLDESTTTYVRLKFGMFDTTSEGSKKRFQLIFIKRECDGTKEGGRVVGGFTYILDNRENNGVEEVSGDMPSSAVETRYTLSGIKSHLLSSGITIVRQRDGSVRKVVVK